MCNLGFSLIFSKEIILELKKIIYYCLKNEMDELNPQWWIMIKVNVVVLIYNLLLGLLHYRFLGFLNQSMTLT